MGVKTHLETGKCGHVSLFVTSLALAANQIIDYYSLTGTNAMHLTEALSCYPTGF